MDFLVEITGWLRETVHPHFVSLCSSHIFYYKGFLLDVKQTEFLIMPSFLTFSRSDILSLSLLIYLEHSSFIKV